MKHNLAAIVLAAGESKRMGQPKMLLPWNETTVLGQVVATLAKADVSNILVVTGGWRDVVDAEVRDLATNYPVRSVFNDQYGSGGMLSSVQAGVRALRPGTQATLIALGDQPQMRLRSAHDVIEAFEKTGGQLIVPSHAQRRGHPFLISSKLWGNLLALEPEATMREFLQMHANEIIYVNADASILQDLDTPEDYKKARST